MAARAPVIGVRPLLRGEMGAASAPTAASTDGAGLRRTLHWVGASHPEEASKSGLWHSHRELRIRHAGGVEATGMQLV
eukprot:COSAG02_NODE_1323_length_13255_cov_2.890696_1_plen_78_part_00